MTGRTETVSPPGPPLASRLMLRGRHTISWLIYSVYAIAAIAAYLPVGPFDNRHLPGGGSGDPAQMVWFLAWTPFALAHGHNILQTSFIDVPSSVNLASNTSVPILGLLAAPITAAIGPIASLNFLLRLGLFGSAATMYLLARRWTTGRIGPFLAGLAYGFGPYLVSQAEGNAHLDLAFAPIPPLLFACLAELVISERRRAWLVGIALGLLAAIQLLISAEVLSDCALLSLVGLVVLALARRHEIGSKVHRLTIGVATALGTFAVCVSAPLWWMFAGPGHLRGPVMPVAHLQAFRADLLEPILPTVRLALAPGWLLRISHTATRNTSEIGGYLGLPLVLLLAALAFVYRREVAVRLACLIGAFAFVLSLGSRLTVDGHTTPVPLPEALLAHLPLLDSTVPARFSLEVLLFSALVLAVGIDRTIEGWSSAGRTPHLAGTGLGLAVVISFVALAPAVPFSSPSVPWPTQFVTALTDDVPAGAAVLTYPYPTPPFDPAMVWQAESDMHFRLLGGYASVNGPHGPQYWPPLLRPEEVQERLGALEAGAHSHFPAPPKGPLQPATLCRFLHANKVDAVAVFTAAHNANLATQEFSTALGSPRHFAGDLDLWSGVAVAACR